MDRAPIPTAGILHNPGTADSPKVAYKMCQSLERAENNEQYLILWSYNAPDTPSTQSGSFQDTQVPKNSSVCMCTAGFFVLLCLINNRFSHLAVELYYVMKMLWLFGICLNGLVINPKP